MPGIHNGIGTTFRSSAFGGAAPVNLDFVSTWDTTKAGSASNTVVLPLLSGGVYSGTIDWGDGTTSPLSYANRTHVYATTGIYNVTITGTIGGWYHNNTGDKLKIIDISNWGTCELKNSLVFYGCANLDISATDAPIISTTNFSGLFRGCTSLTTPDLSNWDVSSVTSTYQMFLGCTNFNGDISSWNTASFADMRQTFYSCTNFNSDISSWDVSSVTTLRDTFRLCTNFNSDISSWNTPLLTDMNATFHSCINFNRDISSWDVSGVKFIQDCFKTCVNFNQPIGLWTTTSLLTANYMLDNCDAFDQDISNWDVNQVTGFIGFMINATGLSTANYDALLIAWDAQGAMSYSGTVNFGLSKYTAGGAAEAARTSLITKWGGITDGGPA